MLKHSISSLIYLFFCFKTLTCKDLRSGRSTSFWDIIDNIFENGREKKKDYNISVEKHWWMGNASFLVNFNISLVIQRFKVHPNILEFLIIRKEIDIKSSGGEIWLKSKRSLLIIINHQSFMIAIMIIIIFGIWE